MPYISKYNRVKYEESLKKLDKILSELSNDAVAGEVNFIVTSICKSALSKFNRYTRYNAIIGALECAKLELYRRQLAAYEDQKIEENGDV